MSLNTCVIKWTLKKSNIAPNPFCFFSQHMQQTENVWHLNAYISSLVRNSNFTFLLEDIFEGVAGWRRGTCIRCYKLSSLCFTSQARHRVSFLGWTLNGNPICQQSLVDMKRSHGILHEDYEISAAHWTIPNSCRNQLQLDSSGVSPRSIGRTLNLGLQSATIS